MATAPRSAEDFVALLEQSGLLAPEAFQGFRAELDGKPPAVPSAEAAASAAVERKVITRFQADQLLAGRHRGFQIGRYRIQDLLGIGAMGRVYLAEHAFMRRSVAIKVLPKTKAAEPSSIERFHREARVIAALNHPNIVQAYDFDEADGVLFIVMEYVNGKSLQEFVQAHGAVPWPQACDFVCQAAAGLQHAGDNGVIHRDIKPGNLLLDRTGMIKLLDMGLARVFGDVVEADGEPLSMKYNERVLGTADYLAPEQAVDSHTVDIRADIYSLGLTMYFMLTGRLAAPEGTVAQKLVWHQTHEPTPIRELRADVPPAVAAILGRMIAKRAEARYQTPEELRVAMSNYAVKVRATFDG